MTRGGLLAPSSSRRGLVRILGYACFVRMGAVVRRRGGASRYSLARRSAAAQCAASPVDQCLGRPRLAEMPHLSDSCRQLDLHTLQKVANGGPRQRTLLREPRLRPNSAELSPFDFSQPHSATSGTSLERSLSAARPQIEFRAGPERLRLLHASFPLGTPKASPRCTQVRHPSLEDVPVRLLLWGLVRRRGKSR